ncbi:outer membrane beta-barrel protein [Proteiniphilum sp.]|uniref:outer membrane beta-barrel protein n=1 Tax=Proteiniphilum sp. TaxID=1926877 RepID=UPI0033260192
MRSDDQYIDKPDDFSKKVGEKLRAHQIPVGPDVWDSLAEKLPPRKKTVSGSWYWTAAGVAVVVLAILFLWNPVDDGPLLTENSQSTENTQSTEHTPSPKQKAQGEVVPDIIHDDIKNSTGKKLDPDQIVGNSRGMLKKTGETGKIPKQEKTSEQEELLRPEEFPKLEEVIQLDEMSKSAKISKSEKTSEPEKTSKPEKNQKPEEIPKLEKSVQTTAFAEQIGSSEPDQTEKPHSLMAALGSGGVPLDFSLGGHGADNVYDNFPGGDYNDGSGVGSGGDYNLLTPGDYTDVVHRLPVSFSLTADFPIAKDMTLETGLSYTYLFSRYRRNDQFIYRGTLQQHYIGIPLNLRYTVWQNDAWDVYLLGGASIEKGLRSIYKQEIEHNGGIVYHTKIGSSINGFQFSAQAGAGFSYRLQGNLSLFGEPRIVYYFNNNQPMSARTENPLIFGLNMGIRFRFK